MIAQNCIRILSATQKYYIFLIIITEYKLRFTPNSVNSNDLSITDKYSTRNNPHKVVYSLIGISIDAGGTKVWPVTINL